MLKKECEAQKSKEDIQKIFLENSVSLQKVLTNLSVNLDNLSNQISKLLNLFEQSVKTIAEKDLESEINNRKMMEKLDTIILQNKTLAQGMASVHEKIPEKEELPRRVEIQQPQQMKEKQFITGFSQKNNI
jgi:hypothetical protein